jgi:hypothetical protein
MPCEVGVQTRTREPVGNQSKTEPKCQGIQFFQSRGCIGPGFCDEVLARFSAIGASSVDGFDEIYKTDSIKLPNPTAGSLMIPSAYQSCSEATSRCQTFTGKTNCDMLFEGHFKVNKGAHYILNYEASEGGGELEFNAFGQGNEKKPQFKVVAKDGTSTLYEWIDVGFHHRRRRSGSKPRDFHDAGARYILRKNDSGWLDVVSDFRVEARTIYFDVRPRQAGHGGRRFFACMVQKFWL